MPRRNFYLLFFIVAVCYVCYLQAGSDRSRYGRMFETMQFVLQQVESNYVEKVDERQLFEGALSGITRQLDEYSDYIGPKQIEALREDLGKAFGGVGIQVWLDRESKQLVISSPLVGSPAYECGVLAGDIILEIDGKSTDGFSMQDVVDRIRGEVGTPIRLTVLHQGNTEPQELSMVRAEIHVDTVLGDTHNPNGSWNFFLEGHPEIGYVRISQFGESTSAELRKALEWLETRKMKGLILDLRNNPGGLLDSSVEICDLFIDDGMIVSTRGRDGTIVEERKATKQGPPRDYPIVVLVNKYSASASEIVSACLQDHERAVIIGERTWGKGSVQKIYDLEGGKSALKLTVFSYWRPSGKKIHRLKTAKDTDEWGVKPNDGMEVKLDSEQFETMLKQRRERDVVKRNRQPPGPEAPTFQPDPQLQQAIECLKEQIQPARSAPAAA